MSVRHVQSGAPACRVWGLVLSLAAGCAQTVEGVDRPGPDGGVVGVGDGGAPQDGAAAFVPDRCAAPGTPADCTARVVEVAAGSRVHACARMSDGTVRCRGDNTRGALGVPGLARSDDAVTVPGLRDVVQVVTGGRDGTTCTRHRDGSVRCWGDNRDGLLGNAYVGEQRCGPDNGPCARQPVPARIDGVRHLALGTSAVCAVRADGSVWCWGRGSPTGAPGNLYPHPLQGVDDAVWIMDLGSDWLVRRRDGRYRFVGVSVGREDAWDPVLDGSVSDGEVNSLSHYCGRRPDGSVWCAGQNESGQLGTGAPDDAPSTYAFTARRAQVEGVRAVASGLWGSCAARQDGTVWCWGQWPVGPGETPPGPPCLPGGSNACVRTPQRVPGLDRVTAVSLGVGTFRALRDDGTVWAWGRVNSPVSQVPRREVW